MPREVATESEMRISDKNIYREFIFIEFTRSIFIDLFINTRPNILCSEKTRFPRIGSREYAARWHSRENK